LSHDRWGRRQDIWERIVCINHPATGSYPEPAEEGLLAPRPTPSWRTTHCRLSATAYSIYSQLPSVSGGLPSIRNLRTRHAVVTRDPPNRYFTHYFC
jgi:hypothetical protein